MKDVPPIKPENYKNLSLFHSHGKLYYPFGISNNDGAAL